MFVCGAKQSKKKEHIRILLAEEENKDLEWQSLLYINTLRRDPSIDAFFAGYRKSRRNWKYDVWSSGKAIKEWNTTSKAKIKKK